MDESQEASHIRANEMDRRGDQPSVLAMRLIQRITHPIGVVDVRHPEEIYARTVTWLSKRFPLLEPMMARGRNSDGVPFESSGFVFRMTGMDGDGNEEERIAPPPVTVLPRLTASSFSSPSGSITGEPLPSSSARLFRVSRRPHRGVVPSSARGTPRLSAETDEEMPRASHSVHRAEEKADLSVRSVTGEQSAPVQSRESSKRRAASLSASDAGSAGTEEKLVLRKANPLQNMLDAEPFGQSVETGRSSHAATQPSDRHAAPGQQQPRGDVGPAPPLTHHGKRGGPGSLSPPSAGPFVMTERVGRPGEQIPWLSSRMRAGGRHSRVSPSSEDANVNLMVWKTRTRSIENVEEALRNLSRRVVQRQDHETGSAEAGPSLVTQAHTAQPSAASPQEAKVDIGALAEKVSRVMARQLIAERERRGVDGWR